MTRRVGVLLVLVVLVAGSGCARKVSGGGGETPASTVTSHPSATASTSVTSTSAPQSSGSVSPPTSVPRTTPRTSSPQPPPSGLPSWLLGKEWSRIPTSRPVVALTFDAGGDAAGVASILATLAREHVPGTFFMTGAWVTDFPSQARSICSTQRVGDHSVTHPHFTTLSDAEIRAQVRNAATIIRNSCGKDPAPLFRFPYGDRDARTIRVVNSVGYVPVSWTVDTLGWQGTSAGMSVHSVIARVVAQAQPGEIVLMHVGANPDDRSTLDADALPGVIQALRSLGYDFVNLNALLTAG